MPVFTTSAATSPSADWADRTCEAAFQRYHTGLRNEARQLCLRVLETLPTHGPSLYLLGLIAINSADPQLALELVDESLRQLPDAFFCHLLRGQALFRLKRYGEATASLEHALQLRPGDPDALTELGYVSAAAAGPDPTIELFRRSLAVRPDHLETLAELGTALRAAGRPEEAIPLYRRALQLSPGHCVIRNNLGLAYGEAGQKEKAAAVLEEAVVANPEYPIARFNLSQAYFSLMRYEDAAKELETLTYQHPAMPEATVQRGTILFHLGRTEEGLRWNRERGRLCRSSAITHSLSMLAKHYDPDIRPTELFEEHLLWRTLHAPSCPSRPPVRSRRDRLRVGYVSGDFRCHPVGWFLRPVLSFHDKNAFNVYSYSTVDRRDVLTDYAISRSIWRDVSKMSDDRLEQQVRDDGIDILVDLAGHTAGNRLLVFARRPAPVQVTWLGYPNTTGLDAMDYRITDPWADPPGLTGQFHSEKLYRMSSGFLCYGADPDSPQPSPPNGPITFGCFNSMAKINDRAIRLWAEILRRVAASRLFLKNPSLQCEATRGNLLRSLASAGVETSRVVLDGYDDCHSDHLAAYNKVDVALDTFPYNGTTSTYDALWMGVPVVALEGDSHVSRVGVSILHQAGRRDWLAATPDEYVEIAVRLAGAPGAERRERLLPPAMIDGAAFTRALEDAYREMVAEAAAP